MNLKRYRKTNKKLIIFTLFLLISLLIGLGYAYLTTNLSISGNISIERRRIFPTQIEDVIDNDTCMTKYEGQVTDEVGVTKTAQDVWFNKCPDKRNIIFGGFCWQMLRTTETGGIKMVYNGEPVDGKCESTRSNHKGIVQSNSSTSDWTSTYLYGDSFTYDTTNNTFTLTNTFTEAISNSTYENILGKFTCRSLNDTCTTLYNINTYSSTDNFYVPNYSITNTSYSQIGKSSFNANTQPAMVGYMFNKVYRNGGKYLPSEGMYIISTIGSDYYYADSYSYNNSVYTLVNPYQVSPENYSSLIGKYTLLKSYPNYSTSIFYYIVAINNNSLYMIKIANGENLSDINYTYTYGDSYTDNGNGTYTINNPTTIYRSDWYNNYTNINNKYICKNTTNNTCSDIWYSTDTKESTMTYIKLENNYKYANGFTYNEATNTYTLNNDSVSFWNIDDGNNRASLNSHHYTCWNDTGICSKISYIFYINNVRTLYYLDIEDGKNINNVLEDTLSSNDINTYNSTIKGIVDAWYANNLTNKTQFLEDAIYCNRRDINDLGGWDPNGGSVADYLHLDNNSGNRSLICPNETDQFAVSNNLAKLTYPVGLLERGEKNNLYSGQALLSSGESWWGLLPDYFGSNYGSSMQFITSEGTPGGGWTSSIHGIRPVVSLKKGITFFSGTGSATSPWIVQE